MFLFRYSHVGRCFLISLNVDSKSTTVLDRRTILVEETQVRPRGLRTYWTSFDHTYVMTMGRNVDRPRGTRCSEAI